MLKRLLITTAALAFGLSAASACDFLRTAQTTTEAPAAPTVVASAANESLPASNRLPTEQDQAQAASAGQAATTTAQ
jgi:hypothetical protein